MKNILYDQKQGILKLSPETLEDLWHLENVLEKGDLISASSFRTVKFGEKEEKKHIFVTISLENIEFSKSINRLRLLGKIVSGTPEDFVQIGRHHTIDVETGEKIQVQKQWKSFQLKRIREAEKEGKRPLIKIIAMDDEKAVTAVLRGYGIDYGPEIESNASKRSDDYESKVKSYFSNLYNYLKGTEGKFLVAGPGFAKENFKKYLNDKDPELSSRMVMDNCSYAEKTGITELLKRGVIEKIIGEQRIEKEEKLIEEFISKLNKEGLIVYGFDEVKRAIQSSAIGKILVLDSLLRLDKNIQELIELSEKSRVELIIFSSDSDAGMKLKGFGGVAGFLRFKI